ncbi:uncharacterized protein J3R85_017668 [Psidium guajava]|nr:uncharacterized protein J3R85_017668 [Psidium guajava]
MPVVLSLALGRIRLPRSSRVVRSALVGGVFSFGREWSIAPLRPANVGGECGLFG